LEAIVDELTATVYVVVLQRGRRASWLDLQLDLWRALTDYVVESKRKRMIADTADAAL
jgi:hypothetical protein